MYMTNGFNGYQKSKEWGRIYRLGGNIAMIKVLKVYLERPVHATDIRTGASLIIAALQADGLSTITGIDHITGDMKTSLLH